MKQIREALDFYESGMILLKLFHISIIPMRI